MAALRAFNIEAFTLLALALLITALRTYVRISTVGWRNLWADDYLILLAAVVYSVETGLAYSVGNIAKGMANNSMTDAQRAALQPDDTEYQLRVLGSKIQLAGWSTYSFLLWILKGAMCTFYYRLTKDLEGYRTRILVGFALIIVTFVVVQLNLILSCHPFYRWWQIYPDPGVYCHPAISPNLVWTYLSFNVATDLYLIMIPMPMLWKAAMPWFQKVWLIALFSCGLFVTMAAILRVVLLVSDPVNGAQLAGSWAVRETFVAVLVTNLPMLFPQLKKWAIPIVARVSSSLSASRNPSSSRAESRFSNITSLDSWRRKSRRSSRPISINPPRNNESEVTIIDEVNHPETELQPTISEEDTHTITKEDPAPRIQLHIEVSVLEETETNNRRASTRSGNYAVSWSDSPPKTEKP
ncbi:hypothetical protein BHE90_008338 [Fusarium euwallaceae]|uniref:Rhodopsin domain-containing protein n=2 Tax=Fusarium solani species complex TaxID=232080 RepID=A0A3M2S5C9_9HYPO|nr:hypothetical protein CDV36_007577 [Fusarium kuroshium]RTE77173.1 hypothetical protein BHE90_008338 [Fusarium euwallaceae]